MRADDDIVSVDHQIAHGSRGQVKLQRLPGVAVVERDVDGAFGAGEKQPLAQGIFAHHVDGRVIRNASRDFLPGLPAIVSAIDVGVQIVKAETIHRGVHGVGIEMRSVELGDLAPGRETGG